MAKTGKPIDTSSTIQRFVKSSMLITINNKTSLNTQKTTYFKMYLKTNLFLE